jgi:hypothetical protein
MRPASSPGSTTIASRLSSSPKRIQLQASGPTGKLSKIMLPLYDVQGNGCERAKKEGLAKKSDLPLRPVSPFPIVLAAY